MTHLSPQNSPNEVQTVFKVTSEDVTNSTTMQNDDDLFVELEANSVYRIELGLIATAPNNTPDFKWNITTPAGTQYFIVGDYSGGGGLLAISRIGSNFAGDGQHSIVTPDPSIITLTGFVYTAGTAGTLQLQWAQLVADAGATTLEANSWIKVEKLNN